MARDTTHRDMEDGSSSNASSSDEEEERRPHQPTLADHLRKACFWARIAEAICACILVDDSLFTEGCFFFSYAVLSYGILMIVHLVTLTIPLQGRLMLLKPFRIVEPWACIGFLSTWLWSCIGVYISFMGGCSSLFFSLAWTFIPMLLYLLAIRLGERGSEMLA